MCGMCESNIELILNILSADATSPRAGREAEVESAWKPRSLSNSAINNMNN